MQIGYWSLNYNTVFIPLNEWFFSYIPHSFLICITYCRFIFIFICSRFNFNFLKLFLHKARNTFVQWNGRQTLLARSLCFTRLRNEPGLFQITAQRLISAPEAASVVNQIPVTQVITSNRTSGNGRACITCWRTVGVVERAQAWGLPCVHHRQVVLFLAWPSHVALPLPTADHGLHQFFFLPPTNLSVGGTRQIGSIR